MITEVSSKQNLTDTLYKQRDLGITFIRAEEYLVKQNLKVYRSFILRGALFYSVIWVLLS